MSTPRTDAVFAECQHMMAEQSERALLEHARDLEREREGLREHVRSALRELAGGKPSDAEMHLQLALAGSAGLDKEEA